MSATLGRPRYASYLPPAYLDDPKGVLAGFLALFEALMSGIEPTPRRCLEGWEEDVPGLESLLDGIERFSDPLKAPASGASQNQQRTSEDGFFDDDFLSYLGSWMALAFRQNWPEAKKRRLIQNIVPLYKKRGTLEGIRNFLEIFIGDSVRISEGGLGLQVGERCTVGEDTRVGGLAHMFDVEITCGYRESGEQKPQPFDFEFLRSINEVLDREKPAHAAYRLHYPGIVVGKHSTAGWDTLIWSDSEVRPSH